MYEGIYLIGNLFIGMIGILFLFGFLFWGTNKMINREDKRNYRLLEAGLVRKIADKLDVDINTEMFLECYKPEKSTIKKAIEDKILKDYFDEENFNIK